MVQGCEVGDVVVVVAVCPIGCAQSHRVCGRGADDKAERAWFCRVIRFFFPWFVMYCCECVKKKKKKKKKVERL